VTVQAKIRICRGNCQREFNSPFHELDYHTTSAMLSCCGEPDRRRPWFHVRRSGAEYGSAETGLMRTAPTPVKLGACWARVPSMAPAGFCGRTRTLEAGIKGAYPAEHDHIRPAAAFHPRLHGYASSTRPCADMRRFAAAAAALSVTATKPAIRWGPGHLARKRRRLRGNLRGRKSPRWVRGPMRNLRCPRQTTPARHRRWLGPEALLGWAVEG